MKKDNVPKKEQKNTGAGKSTGIDLWNERLAESDREYKDEREQMTKREALYAGTNRKIKPFLTGDTEKTGDNKNAPHVRNIIFENIEAQISSSIPQPKITPRKQNDEQLAESIEHLLRNELDRLPFEIMNDMAERAVPIHGGIAWHIEWDNERGTHNTVGDITVSLVHPMQLAPQPGIYTSVQDMDWIIVKVPTTKEAVLRKYGVDISDEGESEPEIRTGGETNQSDDSATKYIGYSRNKEGSIDRFIWVNDQVLEDMEDYQARKHDGHTLKNESIYQPFQTEGGLNVPGMSPVLDEFGTQQYLPDETGFPMLDEMTGMPVPMINPTQIPYYKPDVYPIVLQKNVSVYGQLFGNSDVDVITDHQETINRMHRKIIDRTIKAGSKISVPNDVKIRWDTEEGAVIRLETPDQLAMLQKFDFDGNIAPAMAYEEKVYQEARQAIGVTDSFQGRKDTTATSGKAKEFAAAQTAGRLESKRVMKDAAYADLFEIMFKFALAYSDEPRTIVHKNTRGVNEYSMFNRYNFLEQDESGEYYWNDQFLFSTDTSAPLASNREAMWQEMRMNLQTGAFGNPAEEETLILFWSKMEMLHYPYAGMIRKHLEDKLERIQQQMAEQQSMQGMQQDMLPGMSGAGTAPGLPTPGMTGIDELPQTGHMDGGPQLPQQVLDGIERQAMEDAMMAAQY